MLEPSASLAPERDSRGRKKLTGLSSFGAPEAGRPRRGVRLLRPGFNLPTLGAVLFLWVQIWVELSGGVVLEGGDLHPVYHAFATSWHFLTEGKIWGLFSHQFLHGSWGHVGLNSLVFYYAAARLGHLLRPIKVILLFGVCGMIAATVHTAAQAVFPGLPAGPLVGASGGIMGLFLAQTVLYPDSRMLLLPVSGRNMGKGVLTASLLLFLITPGLGLPGFAAVGRTAVSFLGESLFQIAHLYHFVGGVMGMLLVERLLPRLVSLEDLKRERVRNET